MTEYYHAETPAWLAQLCEAPSLRRLKGVGMNCGCEYTRFPLFRTVGSYSRFRHSLGCALIVWHFTRERADAAAALLHDIATPVFSHTVDFLQGDYLKQESTEARTEQIIREDAVLCAALQQHGLTVSAVADYHQYPIADNDSPRLSADRLEYTLGNLENYRLAANSQCRAWYEDLCVGTVDGTPELTFRTAEAAEAFALAALRCSRIYVSREDRYSMQRLSEVLKAATARGVLRSEDLYGTEAQVISRLQSDAECRRDWTDFCGMQTLRCDEAAPAALRRVIHAKKRWIDPAVVGIGRVSAFSDAFRSEKDAFLGESQEEWICAT